MRSIALVLLRVLRRVVINPVNRSTPAEVEILQRARTPADVLKILKKQARQAPKDRTGRARAGKEIP